MKDILGFKDEYEFLSNFYPRSVEIFGYKFYCRESAYQAMKSDDKEVIKQFTNLNGMDARRLGRKVTLRPDWDSVKDDIMFQICITYFDQHIEERERLIQTGDAYIEKTNHWNDSYWGVY